MRRCGAILIALALVGALATAQGCAKQEETIGTTTDSTLSLGDFPEETSPAPGTELEPAPDPAPAPSSPPASRPRPAPKPTPSTPKPAPTPSYTVSAGTEIKVTMDALVSTKDKVAGDTFTGQLAEAVTVDGVVVFPAGSTVNGHVVEAVRPGKSSGRGKMVLAYDSIVANGKTYAINSTGAPIEGKSGTKGDVAKIGGGAAAGAIIGGIIGGSGSSAAKGAAVGGAAGTAATLLTRGPDPEVKAGQTVAVVLDNSVTVSAPN
jgi:hypothetical protein